jgi:lysozyme family protein
MQSNWDTSFELLMDSEGGFSDDPHDNGNRMPDGRPGCTNLGVTMMTWEIYVQRQSTIDEMKSLTKDDVEPLYKRLFWDRVWGDKQYTGIDYLLFDCAVNTGVSQSVLFLQRAVGASPDGAMGPLTYAATITHDPKDLIEQFSQQKINFYKGLNNPKYEKGWLNRVAHVKDAALIMVNQ